VALFAAVQAAALFIVLGAINGASAAPGTMVVAIPDANVVEPAETFQILVEVQLDPNDTSDDAFDSFTVALSFNPALVQITSIVVDSMWVGGVPIIDNNAGTASMSGSDLLNADPCDAECPLFIVNLQATSNLGPTNLNLQADLTGDTAEIGNTAHGAAITVTDGTTTPSPTASETPSPSLSATPSPTVSPSASPTPSPSASPSASPSPEPTHTYPIPMLANDGLIT
jgi:hypothetical protein